MMARAKERQRWAGVSIVALLLATACVGAPPVLAQQPALAATVNGEGILKSELDEQVAGVVARMRDNNVPQPSMVVVKVQVLENLITQKTQQQRAQQLALTIPDEDLVRVLRSIARRNGATLEEMPALLSAEGFDFEEYRADIRTDLLIEKAFMQDIAHRMLVPRSTIESYFAIDGVTVNQVRHIFKKSVGTQQDAQLVEFLNDLKKQLEEGADFAELAKRHSDDPQSASAGGELGDFVRGAFVMPFERVIAALSVGQVSEPFRTDGGWHIAQLTARRADKRLNEEVRMQVIRKLREDRKDVERERWIRELRLEAGVQVH